MKTKLCYTFILAGLFLIVISGPDSLAQDSLSQRSQMLDLKLQLLDSKLELLDTKIKLWEAKPKELDIKLNEIDSKISSMNFDPQLMTNKINKIDSLFRLSQEKAQTSEIKPKVVTEAEPEPKFIYNSKSSIMLDPVRLLEGTFCLSYERILNNRFSVNVSGMATYSTKQGLSKSYFANQSFELFSASTNDYQSYEGEVMSGGGINIQLRNYLLANHPKRLKAPLGLYAAPQLMYRNLKIAGHSMEMEEVEPGKNQLVEKQVNQHLDIYAGGVIIGLKVPVLKVLTIDLFAGGNIRLSKYTHESDFTRYKNWSNFDFSGVSPVAGIAIGILK